MNNPPWTWAETASHLYFVNSAHERWLTFQSTHPLLAKRILAIDRNFDGQFHRIDQCHRDAEYDRLYEESVRNARAKATAQPENSIED